MTIFFLKKTKYLIFWSLFTQIYAKMNFLLQLRSASFWYWKNLTTNEIPNRQTDGQTYNSDFIEPSVGRESNMLSIIYKNRLMKMTNCIRRERKGKVSEKLMEHIYEESTDRL